MLDDSELKFWLKFFIPGLPAIYCFGGTILGFKYNILIIVPFFVFWGLMLWLYMTILIKKDWMIYALVFCAMIWVIAAFCQDLCRKANYKSLGAGGIMYFIFGTAVCFITLHVYIRHKNKIMDIEG